MWEVDPGMENAPLRVPWGGEDGHFALNSPPGGYALWHHAYTAQHERTDFVMNPQRGVH